ncbi:MAG: SDR family oxidoreductase [Atopostipes sp.]|nr:SDR family oxidoreductase [Atopostipes sp.]
MKVLIFGANGQIGQHLVEEMKNEGEHEPIAFVRKKEQVEKFEEKGIETRLGNLEDSIEEIAEKMNNIEAIVFTAGSGGSTGSDKTLLIDLDGAVKVMEAAKKENIERFMMISAFGAESRERWSEELKPYYVAKHFADEWLKKTDLNYTIIRPGVLTNEKSIGKIRAKANILKNQEAQMSIPRVDVAKVLLASLDNENTYQKTFDLLTGEKSIDEALNSID